MAHRRKVPGRKSLWWLDRDVVERVNELAIARGVRPGRLVNEALIDYVARPESTMSARSLLGIVKFPTTWR